MEQLQQALEFVKKWRFWICIGVAVVSASLISFFGTPNVREQVAQRKNALEGAYQNVSRFAMGVHPNRTWKDEVAAKEQEASAKVAEIQKRIFAEQASKMTWPDAVASEFNPRPFNSPLDDQQGTLLFAYFRAFDKQYEDLRKIVDPVEVTDEGEVVGKVVMRESALDRPKWTSPPPSVDAWLAQEQVWIQRAVLEAVARVNASAKSWYEAPIREVLKVSVGIDGVDSKRASAGTGDLKLQELAAADAPAAGGAFGGAPAPSSGGAGGEGLNRARYLQITPDYREIPVLIRVLADHRKLPEILAAMAEIDFGFVISEVSWTIPASKVEVPKEIQEYSDMVAGSSRDVVENTIELTVMGDVRIYETPADLKQKYEQERLAAQQPTPPAGL
jgi:hypothetical protein